MKLLMISTDRSLFTPDSSVSIRVKKLIEKYDEIHVIVFSLKNLFLKKTQLSSGIFLYPTNSFFKFLYIIDAIICGIRIIKNNNLLDTDLITCQDPFEVGLVGYLLKKIFKIKLELQIHTDLYSPYFIEHSLLNKIRIFISNIILARADLIRVVSERIKKSLVERGINDNKIIIKPIAVDLEKLRKATTLFSLREKFPNFVKIILVVSRLEKEKNVDGVIQAFSLLVKENAGVGLIIVGSGRELSNLKNLARKLKVESQVVFVGWQTDLVSYYRGCDCVLIASWYEGYGLIYKEAEALNCRIISTDVGIAREVGAEIVGWKPKEIALGLKKILL